MVCHKNRTEKCSGRSWGIATFLIIFHISDKDKNQFFKTFSGFLSKRKPNFWFYQPQIILMKFEGLGFGNCFARFILGFKKILQSFKGWVPGTSRHYPVHSCIYVESIQFVKYKSASGVVQQQHYDLFLCSPSLVLHTHLR